MVNSKAKGNSYEREFAQFLTGVFCRNFTRNLSGSGAFFGGGNFNRKLKGRDTSQVLHELGDIVPPTGFYIVSECKNYKDFPFHLMLQGRRTVLNEWIEEVRHDSRFDPTSNEVTLPHWVSFKVTRRGCYLALPSEFFGDIVSGSNIPYTLIHHERPDGLISPYLVMERSYLSEIKTSIYPVITDVKYYVDDISDIIK